MHMCPGSPDIWCLLIAVPAPQSQINTIVTQLNFIGKPVYEKSFRIRKNLEERVNAYVITGDSVAFGVAIICASA